MNSYPTDLLVEVDWLKQNLDDPHPTGTFSLRVLDVRANDPRLPVGYRMGHIRHAIELDISREFFVYAQGKTELAAAELIAEALAQRGIANDTPLVIYDEWTGQLATFAFWVLRYIGHRDLKILHGGWAAWKNSGGETTREIPQFAPEEYTAHPSPDVRATADWIQENAARPDILLLDVRSSGEYQMGHIPGAVNLPWDSSLEMRTQTFKNASTLQEQLEAVGATPDKEIVAYCASGARSSHTFTTLQLLGYSRVRNYDGSMHDWYQARGLPIE